MPTIFQSIPDIFSVRARKSSIPILPFNEKTFEKWIARPDHDTIKPQADLRGFRGQAGKTLIVKSPAGEIAMVLTGIASPCSVYSFAQTAHTLRQEIDAEALKPLIFSLTPGHLSFQDIEHAFIGWGLAAYEFDAYKASAKAHPKLAWHKMADRERVLRTLQSVFLLKNMINMPANDFGPAEIEKTCRAVANAYKARVTAIKGKELLAKNFPLIHAVGKAAEQEPRLIDIRWGSKSHPKLTLVGKGVSFDTGGLNIKPSAYMALMKKDMGGAAHALALGRMIMDAGLPVQLRILIPAVENAISASAFRPGDIYPSRKGLSVENTNTDAEGRLILADALTLASEDEPDLIIDFATLTGSARAALGPDIPAMFCNDDKLGKRLQAMALQAEDPLWQMPLWHPYHKLIESPNADLLNSAAPPGDLIYSALFLEKFLVNAPSWIHIDCYAWEHTGKPGRPRGGADTGLRAVYALIEERYGS